MKTKIVSFGDSFVFGSELKNNSDGSQSWIAQAARNLGVDYETRAIPGCGNEAIICAGTKRVNILWKL